MVKGESKSPDLWQLGDSWPPYELPGQRRIDQLADAPDMIGHTDGRAALYMGHPRDPLVTKFDIRQADTAAFDRFC